MSEYSIDVRLTVDANDMGDAYSKIMNEHNKYAKENKGIQLIDILQIKKGDKVML